MDTNLKKMLYAITIIAVVISFLFLYEIDQKAIQYDDGEHFLYTTYEGKNTTYAYCWNHHAGWLIPKNETRCNYWGL